MRELELYHVTMVEFTTTCSVHHWVFETWIYPAGLQSPWYVSSWYLKLKCPTHLWTGCGIKEVVIEVTQFVIWKETSFTKKSKIIRCRFFTRGIPQKVTPWDENKYPLGSALWVIYPLGYFLQNTPHSMSIIENIHMTDRLKTRLNCWRERFNCLPNSQSNLAVDHDNFILFEFPKYYIAQMQVDWLFSLLAINSYSTSIQCNAAITQSSIS